ncbi:MAG: sugar transferase [Spirochaetota bacterium]|nr:sugar transferase [Spirochaetota bacterium]
MHARRNRIVIQLHSLLDVCLIVAAFVIAYFIRRDLLPPPFGTLHISPNYYIILLIIIIIWYVFFTIFKVYTPYSERGFVFIYRQVFKAVSVGMIVLITSLYIVKIPDVSRLLLGIFYFINLLLLFISKGLIYFIWRKYGSAEHNISNIIIIGSKHRAQSAIDLIQSYGSDIKIVGCLEIDKSEIGKALIHDVKVIGTMDDLKEIILNYVVDEVIFAMPLKDIDSVHEYMLLLEMIGITVRIFPDWHIHTLLYEPKIASISFDSFHGFPTMLLATISSKHQDLSFKVVIDYIFGFVIFVLIFPLFLGIAFAIKLFSKGPVFFKQERLGLNGRKFSLYKFRTMVVNAEEKLQELKHLNEADGPAFKIEKDPRIIPYIGTFLRKTSLDELPQLINVLKGEMSLVGPRPPIPSEVQEYDAWQRRRLSMKPGLTCLWQIAPSRNDLTFKQWMELDLKYIDDWSLKLDLKILFRTAKAVVSGSGR